LRIPLIVIKSLITQKTFIELESEKKYLPGDIILKNKNGVFYCGNNILTVYTINEYKEQHLYPYFDQKNGTFIDIGAHAGKYSIKLGQNKLLKIIALEPDNYNFSLLIKNIALNNLTNVIPINKGAFFKKDRIPFYLSDKGEGLHSIFRTNDKWQSTTIEVDALDNIVNDLNLSGKIGLIKIDVEGAEVEVLKGAEKIIEQDHPNLIIEILMENKQNLDTIINMLKIYNYRTLRLDKDNYFFS